MNSIVSFEKPRFELADIVRLYGDDYRRTHVLSPLQSAVLNALANCRTAVLGGHLERCDECGHETPAYNSCRNRCCPKCQGMNNVRWVRDREAELLPVQYFHVVFTLPHELNPLAQYNPALIYNLLFQSATETLQDFANRRWHGTAYPAYVVGWIRRIFSRRHPPFGVPARYPTFGTVCATRGLFRGCRA